MNPRLRSSGLAIAAFAAVTTALGCSGSPPEVTAPAPATPAAAQGELRGPEAFAGIADRAERSRALFLEASQVLLHPRCLNCHPDGDAPAQGDTGQLHDPPVLRGPDDKGVPGLECTSCHQDKNLELARVPGVPNWHLAPRSMAWVRRSPGAICEQVKDPARNGGKSLAEIVDHAAHDPLVAWGWAPGAGRTLAPGSQARFGALFAAWADSGAACPREERRR
jgi:hypothetical protein